MVACRHGISHHVFNFISLKVEIEIISYIDTDTNLRMRFEQIAVVFKTMAPQR